MMPPLALLQKVTSGDNETSQASTFSRVKWYLTRICLVLGLEFLQKRIRSTFLRLSKFKSRHPRTYSRDVIFTRVASPVPFPQSFFLSSTDRGVRRFTRPPH